MFTDTDKSVSLMDITDDGTIYMITDRDTVFRSTDAGSNWTKAGMGLPANNQVTGFAFTSDYVLLGTDNSGAYVKSRTTTSIESRSGSVPDQVVLHDNYPNPFNPSTHISFSLPEARKGKLTVYNILGRRVATLVDQRMKAGQHQANFNADNLSSGIYLYHLKAGDYSQMQKMTLVK